jgi:hypothetical protein
MGGVYGRSVWEECMGGVYGRSVWEYLQVAVLDASSDHLHSVAEVIDASLDVFTV